MSLITKISCHYSDCVELKEFLRGLPCSFDSSGNLIFQNKRNTIKTFNIKADDAVLSNVVIKRYKPSNIFQQIWYSLNSQSKAHRSFFNGMELLNRGFKTPAPIAYADLKDGLMLSYCYYVSAFADEKQIEYEEIRKDDALIAKFSKFIHSLHDNGIIHNDVNFSNVLLSRDATGETVFSVIDINRMRIYPKGEKLSLEKRANDLVRCTGDAELYKKMALTYASAESDSKNVYKELVRLKQKHDESWDRRKSFTKKLKGIFSKS